MRTTVTLASDVAAAVETLRSSAGIGVSEALNRLVRRGLVPTTASTPYVHQSYDIGLKIDVANTGEVLSWLDEIEARERGDEYHPNA